MIIWRGWGILAFIYAAVGMILFAGIGSKLVSSTALPFLIAIGLLGAAAATWFTGIAMNRTAPQRKIDAWLQDRRAQLTHLVETGQFSLGPGQPQPSSMAEAQQMADALFEHERQQTTRAFNGHTLFWIPMQYFAFVWAGVAVLAVVTGVIGALR
ncbi:MAG: hypothetical protein J7484_06100 [Microbacterium sp.]|nr:hypothetical protein [Microbacterium sp.]